MSIDDEMVRKKAIAEAQLVKSEALLDVKGDPAKDSQHERHSDAKRRPRVSIAAKYKTPQHGHHPGGQKEVPKVIDLPQLVHQALLAVQGRHLDLHEGEQQKENQTADGRLIQKIQCQLRCAIVPPAGGPRAAATPDRETMRPRCLPRSRSGAGPSKTISMRT